MQSINQSIASLEEAKQPSPFETHLLLNNSGLIEHVRKSLQFVTTLLQM